MKDITLQEAQESVDHWIKTIGVRYFNELTNMACLTEEVGELARVIARQYGEQSFKEGEKANLSEEMADVLWVLICLANQTGVNLTEAFLKTIEKKTNRDANRHINNQKLNAGDRKNIATATITVIIHMKKRRWNPFTFKCLINTTCICMMRSSKKRPSSSLQKRRLKTTPQR